MLLLDTLPPVGEREIPAFPRQLIAYLPPVMRDVEELAQIMQAEQPEVTKLWDSVQEVLNEQFINSMGDYGVRRWETILQIKPRKDDTLELRKERVLLILRMKLPYTLRWLRGWLDANLGAGNYSLSIDRYTIELGLQYDTWDDWRSVFLDVLDLLGWVRPENMVLGIAGQREASGLLKVGGFPEQEEEIELSQMTERIDGLLLLGGYPEMQQIIEIGGIM
jgi:hypothetical protein